MFTRTVTAERDFEKKKIIIVLGRCHCNITNAKYETVLRWDQYMINNYSNIFNKIYSPLQV